VKKKLDFDSKELVDAVYNDFAIIVAEIVPNEVRKLEFSRQILYSISKEAQLRSWAEVYNFIWEIPD